MRRRIQPAAIAAALCLFTGSLHAQRGAAPPTPPRTNIFTIAAGALVLTHSGQYSDQWAALNLVDGDPATGWSAPQGNKLPATFVIELTQSHRLTSIALDARQAQEQGYPGISAKAVEVWTSNDGPDAGFVRAAATDSPKGARAELTLTAHPVARWVKLIVRSNWGHAEYTELMEVEGYGDPVGAAPARPAIATSFDTNYGAMTLTSNGTSVYGCYDGGTINGATDGRTINVEWRGNGENAHFGGALFILSSAGDFVNGVWYLNGQRQGLWYGKTRAQPYTCPGRAAEAVDASLKSTGRAILYGVRFASDSASLGSDSDSTLQQVLALLKNDPALRLAIEGHTDSTNTDAYNMDLSARRANAVADWLANHGIDRERLKPQGYGRTRPIADNGTPQGRAINRRVEIAKLR